MKSDDVEQGDHNTRGPFLNVGMVECVECPACCFQFDARDRDDDPHDETRCVYTCAACGYSADTEMSG